MISFLAFVSNVYQTVTIFELTTLQVPTTRRCTVSVTGSRNRFDPVYNTNQWRNERVFNGDVMIICWMMWYNFVFYRYLLERVLLLFQNAPKYVFVYYLNPKKIYIFSISTYTTQHEKRFSNIFMKQGEGTGHIILMVV